MHFVEQPHRQLPRPTRRAALFKRAPGYVTLQAMAKVPLRPGSTLQLNGYNLTDQKYYDLLHPAHVVPGTGRTVLVSAELQA